MSDNIVKLLFTGDYYPYPKLKNYCQENECQEVIFGDLINDINEADIAGINIEFPITDSNNKKKKVGPNLKGDPITLSPLRKAGFNLAYISNNHTLDYGVIGFEDTIYHLRKNEMTPIGIGNNLENARKPYFTKINNIKLAFLNFSENEFNVAEEDSPGANPLDLINNVKDIRFAKKNADYVFVIVHAGQDFNHYPPPFMVKRLRFYAEEGASAIICHHSHFIAGYEKHNNIPIFYGLGNIVYPNKYDNERQKTIAVKFLLKKDCYDYNIKLYYFDPDKMKLYFAGENTKYDFSKQFSELSETLKDEKKNTENWMKEIREQEYYRYLILIKGLPHILFRLCKKLKILIILEYLFKLYNRKYFQLWNLMRRETHHDALLHIFKDRFK